MWMLIACAPNVTNETDTRDVAPKDDTAATTDTGDECTGGYAGLFDEVWDVFQATYPYFELKGVDWHAQRAACRPDMCDPDTTYRKFVNQGMDCLLSPLADYHSYVIDTDDEAHGYGLDDYTRNYDDALSDTYLEGGGTTFGETGHVVAGTLLGTNHLYVRVESWSDVDDVDFGDVLALLPEADGYVVDVRGNSGGNESVAQRLGGRLVGNGGVPYAWAQYRDEQDGDPYTYEMTDPAGIAIDDVYANLAVEPRPIALLLGEKCMSSCEGFVSMLVNSTLTRSFGATTRGSTGNPTQAELSDGTIVSVSRWYLTRADGVTPVEWHGIPPDEDVDFTGEERDEVLEAALAWLAGQ
ncbi:MAG: S41 family peptidase [Myxococcota bacterium]